MYKCTDIIKQTGAILVHWKCQKHVLIKFIFLLCYINIFLKIMLNFFINIHWKPNCLIPCINVIYFKCNIFLSKNKFRVIWENIAFSLSNVRNTRTALTASMFIGVIHDATKKLKILCPGTQLSAELFAANKNWSMQDLPIRVNIPRIPSLKNPIPKEAKQKGIQKQVLSARGLLL